MPMQHLVYWWHKHGRGVFVIDAESPEQAVAVACDAMTAAEHDPEWQDEHWGVTYLGVVQPSGSGVTCQVFKTED